MKNLLAISILCAGAACLSAQETRSMIFGRVLDPQSSAVPGATVVVTNVETNRAARVPANETGYYEASLLMPGSYQVTVEAAGFKKLARTGIVLPVATRLEINMQLELGTVAETISVTAEAPLLDTSTVSAGRIVDNRNVMDLPVLGNNPTLLVKLTPGISTNGVNNYLGLHSIAGGSGYYTAGNVGGNEWSIDGVPNNGASRQAAYLPYSDAIQEFKVETANFDVAVGHTSGVSIAMITKSGTNSLHGTATEQHWQQRWNGTSFFVKKRYFERINEALERGDRAEADRLRAQDMQTSGRSNNWATTIGGPVVIPKIYNGKDKLFFFFSYNGFKDLKSEEAGDINRTIPTLSDRQGDFGYLLRVDPVRYVIHDPLSVRPDPSRATHFIRTPFDDNKVPQARITNPAYNAYVNLLPIPNNNPSDATRQPSNNYLAVATPFNWDYKAFHNRMDYQHSDRHRFFGRWSWNDFLEDRGDWTYESARGLHTNGLNRHNLGATMDWVYTLTPVTVLDVAVSANEFRTGDKITVPLQFKPSDVGLPKYLDQKAGDRHILPFLDFNTYQDIGRGGVPTFTRYRLLTSKADLSHIRGKHTLRGGVDIRQHFRTGGGGGNTSGNFSFGNNYTRRNDDGFTPAGDFGHLWAAFMMGFPTGMSVASNDSSATHSPYYAFHGQDNWRLTPKLTLSVGLRVEYEMGPTERFNRAIGNFEFDPKLPISDAAEAAYARGAVAELAASQFRVRGGSTFAGVGGRSRRIFQNELLWLPRAAVAYNLSPKTVIRGGYGLFYDTLNVLNQGISQSGYSRSTGTPITPDFGMTWLVADPRNGIPPMADPFPIRADGTRFDTPPREGLGLMHVVGGGFDFNDFNSRHARQQRWHISVQRQLTPNMLVEVSYAGSASDRVYIDDRPLNPLPEQFFADGLVRNDANAGNMDANIASPFRITNFSDIQRSNPFLYGFMANSGFYNASATIRKNRLLRPYPHMAADLRQDLSPIGEVRTDALQVRFERRFSRGFNLNFAYSRLNAREADVFLNEFDPLPSWRESNDGRPHRVVATGIYELPFGKGRPFLQTGVLNHILGGFQVAASYEFQPGGLLGFGNEFYFGDLADINTGERTLDRWFNARCKDPRNPSDTGFECVAGRRANGPHKRVFPTRIPGLRADMTNQWNANIQRDFRIREGTTLQLRLDALNLQNRSQFAGPSTGPTSTDFGRVTAQTDATKRWIQLQGRIRF